MCGDDYFKKMFACYIYKSIWIWLIWWSVWRSSRSMRECGWSLYNSDHHSSLSRDSTIQLSFTNHRFTSMGVFLNSRHRTTQTSSAPYTDTASPTRYGRRASQISWIITLLVISTRTPPSSSITWCTYSAAKIIRQDCMLLDCGVSIWNPSIGRGRSLRDIHLLQEKMLLWFCINAVWSCCMGEDIKAIIWMICTYTESRIRFGFKLRKQAMIWKLAVGSSQPLPLREILSIFSEVKGWYRMRKKWPIIFSMISINSDFCIDRWVLNPMFGSNKSSRIPSLPKRWELSSISMRNTWCFGVEITITIIKWQASLVFGFIMCNRCTGTGSKTKETLKIFQELDLLSTILMIKLLSLAKMWSIKLKWIKKIHLECWFSTWILNSLI